jgi:hypothetical protein
VAVADRSRHRRPPVSRKPAAHVTGASLPSSGPGGARRPRSGAAGSPGRGGRAAQGGGGLLMHQQRGLRVPWLCRIELKSMREYLENLVACLFVSYGVYACVVNSASAAHALYMLNHSTTLGFTGRHSCNHVPDFLVLVSHFCFWDVGCLCGWIVPGDCWHYSARGHANT